MGKAFDETYEKYAEHLKTILNDYKISRISMRRALVDLINLLNQFKYID